MTTAAGLMGLAGTGAAFSQDRGARGDAIVLDTITVTTTKTEEAVIDQMAGSSVVTRKEVEQKQPDRISDILQEMPGIETSEGADDPSTAINIRGLQDFGRVNVMVEGARQNFQRSGHNANGQFYLEPELIQQVDVVRGPVSSIYGSGAIGGVVQFELLDAAAFLRPDENYAFRLKTSYDTNDHGILLSGTAAVRPLDWTETIANVVWRNDDDYKDGNGNRVNNSAADIVSGFAKTTVRPTEADWLTFTILRGNNDYTSGSPGAQYKTNTVATTGVAKYRHYEESNPWLDINASVYLTSTKADQTRIDGAPAGNKRDFDIETLGSDVFNTSRFSTGAFDHKLTYGGDVFQDKVFTSDPAGSGDEFTPSGTRTVYGGFIQDQISYSTWLDIIGALRIDAYELEGGGVKSDGSRVSPKITLGLTPIEGVQFYGTYAEGYRAPAITETLIRGLHPAPFPFEFLPNPNLKPEVAHNLEGGVNLKFDGLATDDDALRIKAGYFYNQIDNYIDAVYSPFPPPFGQYQYQNIANAIIHGLEVEAAYDAGWVFARAAYARIRGKNDDTGEPLASVFPDKVSSTLGFRFLDYRLTIGATNVWVADQNRVPAGFTPSDSFNLLDVFATYEVNENLTTGITLKNLLDEQYTRYLDQSASPGFSATLSVAVRLGG
ncbi:MAG: TonB-dependent hemoglobin/transferrin/lactoferrin family receptor [Parvibaculaceae bacterium]